MHTVRPYTPVVLQSELDRAEWLLHDWSCTLEVTSTGVRVSFERHYDVEGDEVIASLIYETATDGLPWRWETAGVIGGHEATIEAALDGLEAGLKAARVFTLSGN